MISYKEESGEEVFSESIYAKDYQAALNFAKNVHFYRDNLNGKKIFVKEIIDG